MSAPLVPPLPGVSRTFSVANWNIRSSWGARLAAAAKGLCQMGVGCTVFTKAKLTNKLYSRFVLGCHVIASKAACLHQGSITVLWKPRHWDFEVKMVHIASPNILTFQLVMGGDQFFVMDAYIPTADMTEVDDLCAAWAKCPANCKLLLLGDLNIDLRAL
jgi:hypothetical protein